MLGGGVENLDVPFKKIFAPNNVKIRSSPTLFCQKIMVYHQYTCAWYLVCPCMEYMSRVYVCLCSVSQPYNIVNISIDRTDSP